MPHTALWRSLVVALMLAATAAAAAPASAAVSCDRWAAPWGSDGAAGTAAGPYATPQRLAVSLGPGQTGCLRSGTYSTEVTGPYVLKVLHGGTAAAPIEIRSAPGERAKLFGIVEVPHGSDHVVLSDLDIDGRRPSRLDDHPVGVQIMAADVTVQRSDITNAATKSCMILGNNAGWGLAADTVVRDNVFHDCGTTANGVLDHSIYAQGVTGAQITDNVFLRSAGYAVQLYPNAQRSRVDHNVMVDGGGGLVFGGEDDMASSDNVVESNVIVGSKRRPGLGGSWGPRVGTGNVARNNCMSQNVQGNVELDRGFAVSGTTSADPSFVSPATGDYRLGSSACLAAVGYDTAARLAGAVSPAATAPTPSPASVPIVAPARAAATAPTSDRVPVLTPEPARSTAPKPTHAARATKAGKAKARRAKARRARASKVRARVARARKGTARAARARKGTARAHAGRARKATRAAHRRKAHAKARRARIARARAAARRRY